MMDIFNTIFAYVEQWSVPLWHLSSQLIIDVMQGLFVLSLGWIVAHFVYRRMVELAMKFHGIDHTVGYFAASTIKWFILAFTGIAVLNIFGIQAASIIAVLGAATLAIGLALQGTLSNVASGVLLVLFRPYRVGHYVTLDNTAGTVVEINLFLTELVTPQNVRITLPNSVAWGAVSSNYSHYPTRRLDIDFDISYDDDIDAAMRSITQVLENEPRVHTQPEPWIKVKALGSFSVVIGIRVWCNTEDIWDLRFDLLKAVKQKFDADGITIPYPHQVHISR